METLLNNAYSASYTGYLKNMNQQLAAISVAVSGLPSEITKSLAANTGTPPAVKPESPPLESGPQFKLLPQLNSDDFKNVVHWKPEAYHLLRKGIKSKDEGEDSADADDPIAGTSATSSKPSEAKISTLCCFMEDENGVQLPESKKAAARKKAAGFWLKLYNKGIVPQTYGNADIDLREEFIAIMENTFPWLCYCEDHWKSEQVWHNNYTTWYSNQLKKTARRERVVREKAAREKAAAEGRVIDVDTDESGIQDNQEKPSKRPQVDGEAREPKRRRVEEDTVIPPPPPPPPAMVTTKRLRVRSSISPDYILH